MPPLSEAQARATGRDDRPLMSSNVIFAFKLTQDGGNPRELALPKLVCGFDPGPVRSSANPRILYRIDSVESDSLCESWLSLRVQVQQTRSESQIRAPCRTSPSPGS